MMMDGYFSHRVYGDMLNAFEPRDYVPSGNPLVGCPRTFMGIRIERSSAFPFQATCGACDGTGEGQESTYCPKCKGQGENRFEGTVRNGPQTIMLTVPLPKKFTPYFPRGAVAMPPISRGLP